MRLTARMNLAILVVTIAEVAWTLLCAVTGANLLLYYAGLVAASVVFFVPGLEGKGASPVTAPEVAPETNG